MISTFQSSLLERKQLSEHIYYIRFKPVDFQLEFKAGQYVIFHIPQGDGHPARRLYSMASPVTQKDEFSLIVEIVPNGVASEYFMKMNIGDTVTTQGPAGMFTLAENDRDIIFLATGTGIAPIRSMILSELTINPQKKMTLFWGFPYFKSVYLLDEFMNLSKQYPNLTFYNCLSREGNLDCILDMEQKNHHMIGHVNDAFENVVTDDIMRYHYYVCGGPKVVESLKEYLLVTKTIPREQVHFEKFTV
jgi:ferredoxin-NADP reductase